MSFRDDVDALAARHQALEHELASKTRELDSAARDLGEARAKQRLPLLDNIRVATPCPARWDQMLGDDRVRHCGECKKHVFNLSHMTREDAEALIAEQNGNLCVRYYQRTDGTILTADCTVGVSNKRKRRVVAAGAAALLATGAGFLARSAGKREPDRATTGVAHVETAHHFAQPPPGDPRIAPPVPQIEPMVDPLPPPPMTVPPPNVHVIVGRLAAPPASGKWLVGDVAEPPHVAPYPQNAKVTR